MSKKATPKAVQVGRPSVYEKALTKIKGLKPKVWREVRTFDSVTGAKDRLHIIRNKRQSIPTGVWEFKAEHDRDTNTSRLLARYMGDEGNKTVIRWWRAGELVERVPPKEKKAKKAGALKRWDAQDG